jgi:hypothetical protein
VAAVSLLLLSSLALETPIALIAAYLLLLGLGIGLSAQTLTLVSQNEFSITEVGTATSTFSFFREIGASLGSALVGSLFTAGLSTRLAERLAPLGGTSVLGVGTNSLTPHIADALPQAIRHAVALAYNDAFTPVLLGLVPMMAVGFLAMLFLRETPLRTTNEPFEALAEGSVLEASEGAA